MAGTNTKHIPTCLCVPYCVGVDKNNPDPAESLSLETVQ